MCVTYYSRTVVIPRLGNTRSACNAGLKGSLRQQESDKHKSLAYAPARERAQRALGVCDVLLTHCCYSPYN